VVIGLFRIITGEAIIANHVHLIVTILQPNAIPFLAEKSHAILTLRQRRLSAWTADMGKFTAPDLFGRSDRHFNVSD
jgi:hypothetical protein